MNPSRHLRLSQEKFLAVDLIAQCADYSLNAGADTPMDYFIKKA